METRRPAYGLEAPVVVYHRSNITNTESARARTEGTVSPETKILRPSCIVRMGLWG